MSQQENLSGRLIVTTAADQHDHKFPALICLANNQFCCQRCQMINDQSVYTIYPGLFYCPACLGLGRLTNQDYLLAYPEQNNFSIPPAPLTWTGTLTHKQQQISQKLCQVHQQKQEHLVWAVTGSGKTEMLFAMIAQAVVQGDRIALVAPRVDVCNELYPRIKAAFKAVSICLLHGQGAEIYHYTQILICTVHQLLKFRQAFDLLVLDECDSYPYVNNLMLHQAVRQALKLRHTLIYLSATPSWEYQQRIAHQQLNYSLLNRRFHGQDLPEPQFRLIYTQQVGKLNRQLRRCLNNLTQIQQRFLLFVSSIRQAELLSQLIKKQLPQLKQTFVHAKDPLRGSKIQAFREGKWQALVTTTVLERGVTFFDIDVIVWQADSLRFNTQTLIQIAGRAGRSAQHSDNQVIFFAEKYTQAINQAICQIRKLNHD